MPMRGSLQRLPRRWLRRRRKNFRVDTLTDLGKFVRGQLYWDRGGGHGDTIFLAGQGRSGTTWISEIVNHRNEYRFIDEPFHPGRLRITRVYRPRQYLPPDERDPKYLRPAEAILSGRVRSVWTDRYNRRVLPTKRLIKEVRANLLLPWIRANFPALPMVLVVRHPCAVVTSQFRLAEKWPVDLSRFLSQDELMRDHLEPFRAEIEGAATEFDRHVFAWCIDYFVPLRFFQPGQVHLAFYEDFCVDPVGETRRLFAYLGKDFDQEEAADLSRPSATAQKDSAVVQGDDLVNRWKRDVTPEQVDRTMEILRVFGLDGIYGEEGMPMARSTLNRPGEVTR